VTGSRSKREKLNSVKQHCDTQRSTCAGSIQNKNICQKIFLHSWREDGSNSELINTEDKRPKCRERCRKKGLMDMTCPWNCNDKIILSCPDICAHYSEQAIKGQDAPTVWGEELARSNVLAFWALKESPLLMMYLLGVYLLRSRAAKSCRASLVCPPSGRIRWQEGIDGRKNDLSLERPPSCR